MRTITPHDIAEARLRRLVQDYAETLDGIVEDCGDAFSSTELLAIWDHLKATYRLLKTLEAESA